MCKAFSCLITKEGCVIWKAGIDSHDELFKKYQKEFNLRDDTLDKNHMDFARIEIVPDNGEKYEYLYPEKKWTFQIDELIKPNWINKEHKETCMKAFEIWKKEIYDNFNYEEARNPINPFKIEPPKKITSKEINLLVEWDSVRDSVWDSVWDSVRDSVWDFVRDSVRDSVWDSVKDSVKDSVWDSVWDSVRDSVRDSVKDSVWDSVWDSVRSYIGSLFPKIKFKYKSTKKITGYPFKSAVKLWKMGLVPSFDGTYWRLHSKNGEVFKISKKELEALGK